MRCGKKSRRAFLKSLGAYPFGCERASEAGELVLCRDDVQTEALLGVSNVAGNRLLFSVHFFNAQVANGQHDGEQENEYGYQGGKCGDAVLGGGRLRAPPAAPQAAWHL